MAEMLAVLAAVAALLHPRVIGQSQCRFADDIRSRAEPSRMQRRGINRNAGTDQRAFAVVDVKHLAGKRPEIVDRILRAGVALLGAVAEPDDPFRRMPQMIGAFLLGFGCDRS